MTPPGWYDRPEEFTLHSVLTKKRAGVPPALFSFCSDEVKSVSLPLLRLVLTQHVPTNRRALGVGNGEHKYLH